MAEQDQEDVQGDSSVPAEVEAQAAAGAVNAGGAETEEKDPTGVPWRNRMAEMERRHEKHLQDLQTTFQQQFQQALQQFQQPQIQPAKPVTQQYTDDELLALGNQGHSVAMQEYIARQVQKQHAVQRQLSDAEIEINSLRSAWPDLNNRGSQLFQLANTRYQQLLANGHPATPETQARAMSAVTSLAAAQMGRQQQGAQASEGARVRDVDAHQSVAGSSIAPAGANRPRAKAPTAEQYQAAKNVGVKDAAKALERFRKRAEDGTSRFGPAISGAVERMLP